MVKSTVAFLAKWNVIELLAVIFLMISGLVAEQTAAGAEHAHLRIRSQTNVLPSAEAPAVPKAEQTVPPCSTYATPLAVVDPVVTTTANTSAPVAISVGRRGGGSIRGIISIFSMPPGLKWPLLSCMLLLCCCSCCCSGKKPDEEEEEQDVHDAKDQEKGDYQRHQDQPVKQPPNEASQV